ncbi:Pyruvate kinase [Chlorella sorokiniana]|uniref:Pyruvate kinase n=1 Tax=Chlorella sorokiniana TaxID=3076 RepID=A0A2P6TUE6_CHLSO|nr:Pyruvate kinase [Chlorella sorokiniana]|eukprot:PRW57674.1 Pyruvate kinase [Chlorella sorokiniana]
MPLRYVGKAKAHVFLDVGMEECVTPSAVCAGRSVCPAGAGSKVVITIGPSCQDVWTLGRLLHAGVSCARVDLSWGTKEYHARSVWLDTTGREIVVRRPVEFDESGWPCLTDEKMRVEKDQVITITTDPNAVCSPTLFPVNYPGFPDIVEIGRYLATGSEGVSLYVDVVDRSESKVTCVATSSATLDGLLNVMVCHTEDEDFRADFGLPLLTEHDVDCIRSLGVEDLYSCRALLDSLGMHQTKVIAKIERKAAIRNFEGIAHVADGIIISRGNLGLDFEAEVMALLQKRIISRCNQLGKPVHITRIVDTMVSTPRPTRAEATDVANAVLDGVDGMLLGAETLRGNYPVETVDTVLKLAGAAEQHFDYRTHHELLMGEAFDEELSLPRADVSVSDFRMYHQNGPDTTMHRRRARSYGAALSMRSSLGEGPDGSPTVRGQPLSGPTAMQGIGAGPTAGAAMAAANVSSAARRLSSQAHEANGPGIHLPDGGGPSPDRSTASGGSPQAAGGLSASTTVSPEPVPYVSTFGSLPSQLAGSSDKLNRILLTHAPYLTKLESLASSATRTAEKINAGLIIVMVQSGRTVSLVAKYRPPMPIMAVVVPTLKSTRLGWKLEGKYLARQTLALRGVVPMLAAPMSDGSEDLLSEAVHSAYMQRLVQPNDYVVCVMSQRSSTVVKVVQVNRSGSGLKTMSQLNSAISNEEPDIISNRTPFGQYVVPPSPMTARGASIPGPHFGSPMPHASPARTLSGRPSPFLVASAAPAAPPPMVLGGGMPGGGGTSHFLLSTASEAQAFDDFSAAQLAAEFGHVGGGTRSASNASSTGGGGTGRFSAGSAPGLPGGASPGHDPSSPVLGGGASIFTAAGGGTPHTALDPITEQPSGPVLEGKGSAPVDKKDAGA